MAMVDRHRCNHDVDVEVREERCTPRPTKTKNVKKKYLAGTQDYYYLLTHFIIISSPTKKEFDHDGLQIIMM
jgi:hypothetical protein